MKKTILVIGLIMVILSAGILGGCYRGTEANGKLETQTFDYTDFTAIEVEDNFNLEITCAEAYSITVSGTERSMDRVEVSRTGDTLKLGMRGWEWFWWWNNSPKAVITLPDLRRLDVGGASEGFARGFKSGNDFALQVSGASDIEIDMETGDFDANISGASNADLSLMAADFKAVVTGASGLVLDIESSTFDVTVSGASNLKGDLETGNTRVELSGASDARLAGSGTDLRLECSGASNANFRGFSVQNADCSLSGASDADVAVSDELDVTVSGASNLDYYGNPVLGRTDISGSSDINHRNNN